MTNPLLDAINFVKRGLLVRQIRNAIIEQRYQRITSAFSSEDSDFSALKALEEEIAHDLGVRKVRQLTDLQRLLEEKFQIKREDIRRLHVSDLSLPFEGDIVLGEWLAENTDLKLEHRGIYDAGEMLASSRTTIINGRAVERSYHLIVTYLNVTHILAITLELTAHGWMWSVNCRGEFCGKLMNELNERYDAYIMKLIRGKAINAQRQVIDLKGYSREDLVYPQELGRTIDQLLASFKRWASPGSHVKRWGSLLVGPPGTGKTTIGGLLGAARPEGCTFIYFPAAEVSNSSQISAIFKLAKRLQPCIIQVDDVDHIAHDRRSTDNNRGYTSVLMEAMDGLEETSRLFLLLTSNDVSKMDPAIIERAGRISSKTVFSGFDEICDQIIATYARTFKLVIAAEDVEAVVTELKSRLKRFTPDEGKNVCQRLYLLHGEGVITREQLRVGFEETLTAFHDSPADKSFLPAMKNGHGHRHEPEQHPLE